MKDKLIAQSNKSVHIILGGTFDPVHFAHLRMAQEMLNLFPKAKVSLMPAAYPPHRSEPTASPEQRIEMLKLALQSQTSLQIDDRELKRTEPSYSVVTLQQIRQEIDDNCLIFLMGTDAFASVNKWYQWQKILDLSNILVIGRPASQLPTEGEVAEFYQKNKLEEVTEIEYYSAGKIAFHRMPQLEISSTYIRGQIKCGKSPRFLLPDDILGYIESNKLYRS